MTIPRNLSKLAPGASTSGVLGPTFGGTGLTSPGATGNVLTSDGTNWTSAAPSGGGGAVNLISTQTVLGVASVVWSGLAANKSWILTANNAVTINAVPFYLQFGTGATPTWQTSQYYWSGIYQNGTALTGKVGNVDTGFDLSLAVNGYSYTMAVANINIVQATNYQVSITGNQAGINSGYNGAQGYSINGMNYNLSSQITAIRLIPASGNVIGSFSLYSVAT